MHGGWEDAKDQGSFSLQNSQGRSYLQCEENSYSSKSFALGISLICAMQLYGLLQRNTL